MLRYCFLLAIYFFLLNTVFSQPGKSQEFINMRKAFEKASDYEQNTGKDSIYYKLLDSFKVSLDNYKVKFGYDDEYQEIAVYWGKKYADINPYESIEFFKENYEKARNNGNIKAQAFNMHELGTIYFNHQQIENAVKCYSLTSDIFKELKDWQAYAYSIVDIANVYFYKQQFNIASSYYDEAFNVMKERFKKDDFLYGASLCYRNQGAIDYRLKKYEEALKNYRIALDYKKKRKIESEYSVDYKNIARIFEFMDKDSSYYYYDLAVKTDEKYQLVNELFDSYLNFGRFFFRNEDFEKSKYYYRKSLNLACKNNLKSNIALSSEAFGDLFYEQEQYDSAIFYFDTAYVITLKNNTLLRNKNVSTKLYFIYQNLNQPEKQIKYLKRAYDIEKQSNIKNTSKLQLQYEFYERIKERELAETKSKRLELVIWGISVIALLLGIISFIILKQRKKLKQVNKCLNEKTIEIASQAKSLEEVNEELKRLDQFKEELTGVIVHDLKNPAGAIIGLLDLVEDKDDIHGLMEKSAKQILDLVHNILDVQKYENAEMKLDRKNANIKRLIDNVIEQEKYIAESKSLEIKNNLPDGLQVYIDEDIIARVITNLLSNALKFTPKKGQIEFGYVPKDNCFFIKDTGYGIDKEYQKIIFDRFSQVIAKRSGKVISTGLGLTFCKIAVEAHRGQIWVESEPGKGSTFYFSFPT